mmetsp:Transcript_6732/g.17586  ORF Transcript_6732/g.17586 Transcript_6732/m.17586 type:complete len:209 (+) Transcript_6732:130-756(+)
MESWLGARAAALAARDRRRARRLPWRLGGAAGGGQLERAHVDRAGGLRGLEDIGGRHLVDVRLRQRLLQPRHAHVRPEQRADQVDKRLAERRLGRLRARHAHARAECVQLGGHPRWPVGRVEEAAHRGPGVAREYHVHDRQPHLTRAHGEGVAVLEVLRHRIERHLHHQHRRRPRARNAAQRLADRRAARVVELALGEQREELRHALA